MLLTEIDHVAIAVNDLEAAIDYYGRAFGAEVHHREVVDSDGVEEALVKVADSYIQLTAATRSSGKMTCGAWNMHLSLPHCQETAYR
jgi:catechol 2,3-dioxygenase-like lactoylglutathione lyase family enzyme